MIFKELMGSGIAGLAKRRYYESDIFGLYDDSVSVNDAREVEQVLVMRTKNRNRIAEYDKKFGSRVAAANTDFIPLIKTVQTTLESLEIANQYFVISNNIITDTVNVLLLNPEGPIEETGSVLIYGDGTVYNSYYFPLPISGDNVVIDSNNDAGFTIGSSSVGLAQPQTTSSGQRTGANSWLTLNNPGFSLSKSGDNLLITKAPKASSSITIRDFPFKVKSSNRRLELSDRVEVLSEDEQVQVTGSAYGISLAEVLELDHDADGNTFSKIGYDSSRKTLSNSASFYSDQFIKTPDGLGFFGLIAYGLPITTGTPYDYVRLANFDSKGNLLSEYDLSDETVLVGRQTHNNFYKYSDANGKNSYIYPFDVWNMDDLNAQYSKVGFSVIDEEGKIKTSKIIASGIYCLPGNPCYSPEEGDWFIKKFYLQLEFLKRQIRIMFISLIIKIFFWKEVMFLNKKLVL